MGTPLHHAGRLAAQAAAAWLLCAPCPAAALDAPLPPIIPTPASSPAAASTASPAQALGKRATRADAEAARQAVMALLRALEAGDVAALEARLAPSLPGRLRLLDALQRQALGLQRLQISAIDMQVTAGPGVAVVQLAWEKRAFSAIGLVPQLSGGRSSLMLQRSGGADGPWQLAAVEGDGLLAPGTGAAAPGATLTLAVRALAWSQLGIGCPGTEPLPSSVTPVSGVLTGTALFAPGSTSTSVQLSGTLDGARVGSVPVSVAALPVQLDTGTNPPPTAALRVPLRLDLSGQASGPVTGPFDLRATSADLQVATSYADSPPAEVQLRGDLGGTAVSVGHSFDVTATLAGALSHTALETVRFDGRVLTLRAASALSNGLTADVWASVTANLRLQPDGRYAGSAVGLASGSFVVVERPSIPFSGPVSIALTDIRPLPRAPLAAVVRGAGAVLGMRVGSPPPACLPVALGLVVSDPASQGRGSITVLAQTGDGDSETLRLTETTPGRFSLAQVPMARAGSVRPGNGVIELPAPGAAGTFTHVDPVPLPGTATPRRGVAVLRID